MNGLPSTRPYLIRALHQWCMDHGFTPHIAVKVDASVQVPQQYVVEGEIVLNVSSDATSGLILGQDFIEFKARFGGVPQQIMIPVDHVVAIYARENGQGMAFPSPSTERSVGPELQPTLDKTGSVSGGAQEGAAASLALVPAGSAKADSAPDSDPPPATPVGGKPTLKRIK